MRITVRATGGRCIHHIHQAVNYGGGTLAGNGGGQGAVLQRLHQSSAVAVINQYRRQGASHAHGQVAVVGVVDDHRLGTGILGIFGFVGEGTGTTFNQRDFIGESTGSKRATAFGIIAVDQLCGLNSSADITAELRISRAFLGNKIANTGH